MPGKKPKGFDVECEVGRRAFDPFFGVRPRRHRVITDVDFDHRKLIGVVA